MMADGTTSSIYKLRKLWDHSAATGKPCWFPVLIYMRFTKTTTVKTKINWGFLYRTYIH